MVRRRYDPERQGGVSPGRVSRAGQFEMLISTRRFCACRAPSLVSTAGTSSPNGLTLITRSETPPPVSRVTTALARMSLSLLL